MARLADVNNTPLAFVPISPQEMAKLRGNGRMDAFYRALSVSNADVAFIVGNKTEMSQEAVQNLTGFFSGAEIRVLDVFDRDGDELHSWASIDRPFESATFKQQGCRTQRAAPDTGSQTDKARPVPPEPPSANPIDVGREAVRGIIRRQLEMTAAAQTRTPEWLDGIDAYSQMAGAWYATQAARLGITPEELYGQHPLRVGGASLDATTDRDRYNAPTTQGFYWEPGQRPGLFSLPDIPVTHLTGTEFGTDRESLRAGAVAYLDNLRNEIKGNDGINPKPLVNPDTGWELTISREDRNKLAKFIGQSTEGLQAIAGLRQLVHNAVLSESHPDTLHQNPTVKGIHRLYAAVEIGNKMYRAKLTVRDYTGEQEGRNTNLHALEAIEIEETREIENASLGNIRVAQPKRLELAGQPTTRRTISISDLLKNSTREDGTAWGKYPPTVDADTALKRATHNLTSETQEKLAPVARADISTSRVAENSSNMHPSEASTGILPTSGDAYNQTAWHGTPHRGIENEGFKLEKIGTGEGIQAYGHGIYFADEREVAEGYRKALTGILSKFNYSAEAQSLGISNYEDFRKEFFEQAMVNEVGRPSAKVARAIHNASVASRSVDQKALVQLVETFRRESKGQLYSAEIPDDHELLDWDKPFSEQPEQVQIALEKAKELFPSWEGVPIRYDYRAGRYIHLPLEKTTGEGFYFGLSTKLGGKKAASEYLNSLGIPGLCYFDENSRGIAPNGRKMPIGEGTHNYVIWDESRLNNDIKAYYQRSAETKEAYDERIDTLFAGGKPAQRPNVKVLDRADILGLLGYGDKPLFLQENAVNKPEDGMPRGTDPKHHLTAEDWKKVPDWIEHPVAVFKSQSPTNPDALVLFAPETVNGRPVRIILAPNSTRTAYNAHLMVNAYGESGTHITPVDKGTHEAKALLYLDQENNPELTHGTGLRFPISVRQ